MPSCALRASGHRQVRHRGGVAGECFGSAQADRELGDAKRVEECERFGLTALDEQRKCTARPLAVPRIDILLARVGDHAEIAQSVDLGVVLEEGADLSRVFARAGHPQFDGFQAAQQHPCSIRIADGANRVAQHPHRVHPALGPGQPARDQVRMPADVLGQRINHDIRAVRERVLPQRTEKGVVDGDRWRGVGIVEHRIARGRHGFDIDQRVGRVGGAFEIDHRDFAALRLGQHAGTFERVGDFGRFRPRRKIDIPHPEARQCARDEAFGGSVKRAGVDDHVALRAERQQQRGDRRHAR